MIVPVLGVTRLPVQYRSDGKRSLGLPISKWDTDENCTISISMFAPSHGLRGLVRHERSGLVTRLPVRVEASGATTLFARGRLVRSCAPRHFYPPLPSDVSQRSPSHCLFHPGFRDLLAPMVVLRGGFFPPALAVQLQPRPLELDSISRCHLLLILLSHRPTFTQYHPLIIINQTQ